MKPFFCAILFIGFIQCNPFEDTGETIDFEELITINYAQGLSMYKTTEGTVVTISNPQTNEIIDHFLVQLDPLPLSYH